MFIFSLDDFFLFILYLALLLFSFFLFWAKEFPNFLLIKEEELKFSFSARLSSSFLSLRFDYFDFDEFIYFLNLLFYFLQKTIIF